MFLTHPNKDINNLRTGSFQLITGPMFSGKTTRLIHELRNIEKIRPTICLKPKIDTRYSKTNINSHDKQNYPAITVSDVNLLKAVCEEAETIGIDEVQFFDDYIIDFIKDSVNSGVHIIACGLDLDYLSKPFEIVEQLNQFADERVQLLATCAVCNAKADRTFKKTNKSTTRVEIGGAEMYEARCAICYENAH